MHQVVYRPDFFRLLTPELYPSKALICFIFNFIYSNSKHAASAARIIIPATFNTLMTLLIKFGM
jgi:hypothetical protein